MEQGGDTTMVKNIKLGTTQGRRRKKKFKNDSEKKRVGWLGYRKK